MRRLARAAAVLIPSTLLLAATGCWPGIPIAAIAAAAGGGGGGGGGSAGAVSVHGHIVTDGSAFATSLSADHEPNDRLGMAFEIGPVDAASPLHFTGDCATTATIHALVDDGARRSIVTRELLATGGTTKRAGGDATASPIAVARLDDELLVLDADASGVATRVRVTPLRSGFVKRVVKLPNAMTPAGFTVLGDALAVLDRSATDETLEVLDADDGTPLFSTSLQRGDLAHLAGGEDLASGALRLFTSSGATILEFALEKPGGDLRMGKLAPAFTPDGLAGGIAALGFDGALVHVVDGDGTLHSYTPEGREVATRPFAPAGTRVASLVAHLDLGFDGYHVEVAAGATLPVTVSVDGSAGARLFAFALSRADLEQERAGAPAFFRELGSGLLRAEIDNRGGAAPVEYDLVVGARAGALRYAVSLGDGRRAALASGAAPQRDDAARALAAYLEGEVIPSLPRDRLVEIYRDPLQPDLVPGEVVLGRAEPAKALEVASPKGFALSLRSESAAGYEIFRQAADANWSGPPSATVHGSATRRGRLRDESRRSFALLARLAGAPGVAWREPVVKVRALSSALAPTTTPNDPFFEAQKWAFDQMNVRSAWGTTTGDVSTFLAVVDTGICLDASDLTPNFFNEGYDFISDPVNAGDGDGIDPNPKDEGHYFQNSNHGSHCSGTMGAKGNNNFAIAGINWDCNLVECRALGIDSTGTTTDIAQGILYAARLTNDSGTLPTKPAAVINLSLGTKSNSNVIHNSVKAAVGQGCVVCAAAGNDGNGAAVLFPAAYPESIAIAASDIDRNIADYSNSGPQIDLTAPGGFDPNNPPANQDQDNDGFLDQIYSTIEADQLLALSGTSMACSQASGVCGLLKTLNPALTQGQALSLLSTTAQDILTVGFDDLSGHGIIDANAAVTGVLAVLELSATEVDLGATGNRTLVQAQNAGAALSKLSIATIQMTAVQGGITSWLSPSIATDGKTILLDADRTGLADGDYQIRVDVDTNGGAGSFLVDLTQSPSSTPTDVGTVTIQILASDGTTVVATTKTDATSGYAYSLPPLPHGKYFLQAGVDGNDDGVLHQAGELYGAYPRGAAKQILELDVLRDFEIDFVVK